MASGTRGSSVPRFSTTGRATSLQHVLKNVLECDLTSPLYLSVLQHFGDRISGVILGSMAALWLKHVTLSLKTP
jgi:hypothetical protein